ncbi:MAG: GNAT family N-acetyltransferase [Caldilineaceae bacterium]
MQLLRIEQSDEAAKVLANAFADDPLWLYLLPDVAERHKALFCSFRATMPYYAYNDQVYGIDNPLEGVAIWQPPNARTRGWWTFINQYMLKLLFSPFMRAFPRVIPIFAQFDRMHKQYASAPHYYLSTIGVIPAAQGKGLASQLIKPILAKADAERYSVYTETMTPSNVPLYEHYGFACQEKFEVPETRLSIWSLYRAARK